MAVAAVAANSSLDLKTLLQMASNDAVQFVAEEYVLSSSALFSNAHSEIVFLMCPARSLFSFSFLLYKFCSTNQG